jgi:hypothetical protein
MGRVEASAEEERRRSDSHGKIPAEAAICGICGAAAQSRLFLVFYRRFPQV